MILESLRNVTENGQDGPTVEVIFRRVFRQRPGRIWTLQADRHVVQDPSLV
jgi:hypothetical protein